jgi:hypothetical protein
MVSFGASNFLRLKAFEMRGRYEEGLLGSGVPDDW